MTHAVLPLPYSKPPLSMNDTGATRGAVFAKAHARKEIRETVARLAALAWLPRGVDHVTVQLHYQPRDNRTRDTDNLWATLKPICDALTEGKAASISERTGRKVPGRVGYGLVRDDSPRWMSKPEPIIHQAVNGEPGKLWVELTWTSAASDRKSAA